MDYIKFMFELQIQKLTRFGRLVTTGAARPVNDKGGGVDSALEMTCGRYEATASKVPSLGCRSVPTVRGMRTWRRDGGGMWDLEHGA